MSIVDGSKLLDTLIWHYFAVCVGLYVVVRQNSTNL